jgi:hypothetical protein
MANQAKFRDFWHLDDQEEPAMLLFYDVEGRDEI